MERWLVLGVGGWDKNSAVGKHPVGVVEGDGALPCEGKQPVCLLRDQREGLQKGDACVGGRGAFQKEERVDTLHVRSFLAVAFSARQDEEAASVQVQIAPFLTKVLRAGEVFAVRMTVLKV